MATLVAYWKLDETSGSTLADSIGSNALTLNAGYTLNVTPPTAPSFSTGAVRGTTACIAKKTTGVSGVPSGTAAQSWSMWIKLTSTATDQVIFSLVQGGSLGAGLAIWDGGTHLSIVEYSSAGSMVFATPPSASTWHHIAWTYDGSGSHILYVDGSSAGTATSTPSAATVDQILLGTFDGTTGDPVAGDIDDIRVYTGVLTPTEVSTLAAGGQVPPVGTSITGQAATSARGTLVPAVSVALTGQSATASRGTLTPAISTTLTGQAATSARGTLSLPSGSAALTGQSATASGGTMAPAVGVSVTGQVATSGLGTAVPAIAPPLVGQAATSARGTVTPIVTTPLTGQSATVGRGTLSVAAPPTTPIWQALITEASGTTIGDTSTGTAINLTLGGSTGWTSNTGGVGYNFGNNATLAAANTSLSGTKLQTAFAGATKCSIEFEANLASFITGNVLLYLGNNAVTGAVFLISCDGAGGIIISSADGAYEFAATSGLHVYLIEIDSTLAAGSRIKAKVDGTVKTMIVNTEMTSGAALDVNCSTWSSNRLTMGGTNGSDSLNGSVFYAAIYAITGVVDHTAALIANNDTAPSNNITVALTGIAVAISRGLLAAATAVGLTGQSSTSSQGTVSQGTGQTLTGQQLTTSGGTLGVNVSRAITGIGASATQGTQSAAVATPLTGQSATSAKGFLAPPNTVFAALTGLFATASAGTLRPSIGVSLTGRSVATSIGTTVGAIARSLTGAALSAIGGLFTPVTPVSQRKFLATSLVSADVSLSLVSSDQSRTLVEG